MNEIQKYKRRVSVFKKLGVPSVIIIMMLFIIIILRDDVFGLDDIKKQVLKGDEFILKRDLYKNSQGNAIHKDIHF